MHLFVANGTHQIQEFVFRLPESKQSQRQQIKIGEQTKITGNLTKPEIDCIVRQYAKYGMIPAEEIASGRGPAPFAYQVDKAFSSIQIEMLTQRNKGILIVRGKETRDAAAAVAATTIGASMKENGVGGNLAEVEFTTTEEPTSGAKSGDEPVEEVTVVAPTNRMGKSREKNRR